MTHTACLHFCARHAAACAFVRGMLPPTCMCARPGHPSCVRACSSRPRCIPCIKLQSPSTTAVCCFLRCRRLPFRCSQVAWWRGGGLHVSGDGRGGQEGRWMGGRCVIFCCPQQRPQHLCRSAWSGCAGRLSRGQLPSLPWACRFCRGLRSTMAQPPTPSMWRWEVRPYVSSAVVAHPDQRASRVWRSGGLLACLPAGRQSQCWHNSPLLPVPPQTLPLLPVPPFQAPHLEASAHCGPACTTPAASGPRWWRAPPCGLRTSAS